MDVTKVLGEDVLPFRTRKPAWFKVPRPGSSKYRELSKTIADEGLHTVCKEAACPNIGDCWDRGTATFMILGDTCTRRCGFCNVKTGKPTWNDPLEPLRVARCVARMGLRHAVITSVDRDDLPDLGASVWCGVIRSIRMQAPDTKIECLTPDFRGEEMPLARVIAERPDVFNHNLEVAPRLYPVARRGSTWKRSLRVLSNALEMGEGEVATKSGLMVGFGETHDELVDAFGEMREAGVQILTVGQYLRPTERHLPVVRYWAPEEFEALEAAAYDLGFEHVAAGPLVRSSYHADEHVKQERPGIGPLAATRLTGFPTPQRVRLTLDAAAARQHPDRPHGVRHVRADRGERPRLLLLAARRDLARRSEQRCTTVPAAGVGGDPEGDHPQRARRSCPRSCGTDDANPYLTIFTAMFMHGGLLHLGGNMLFLWIFGNNVEDAMGPVKYIVFYLLGGVAALVLQVVFDPNSTVPTLGASGAIAAVLGGYLLLFPRAKVVTVIFIVFFFTILELPALLVLGFWFVEQALFAANSIGSSGGGVAYFAHVGGFVFGLAAVKAAGQSEAGGPPDRASGAPLIRRVARRAPAAGRRRRRRQVPARRLRRGAAPSRPRRRRPGR